MEAPAQRQSVTVETVLKARAGDFELDVAFRTSAGVTALFGPSGAGKSLTLRHLAGLEDPGSGRIRLDRRILLDSDAGLNVPPRERRVGIVFQEYALFPHMSVEANVGYGLCDRSRIERTRRIEKLLAMTGLEGYGERRPRELSGGERQRVALARALAPEPELLLLDEPFAALDFRVRRELRAALRSLHERTGVPMILVTHSLEDVRKLSDWLVLLDRGRVLASGPTRSLLDDPPSQEARALVSGEELG